MRQSGSFYWAKSVVKMWLTAHTNEATIRVKTTGLERRHKNADLQG